MLMVACFSATATLFMIKNTYEWDIHLAGVETGGKTDYVIFGEHPDASDLVDQYDIPKPPPPPHGYIRIWLSNDKLPYPYDTCWFEYRKSPNTVNQWKLCVQWVPQSGYDETEITLTWDIPDTYYHFVLLDTVNMKETTSYTFTCPAYTVQSFDITCFNLLSKT